jgi:hypothetical protein
MYELLIILIIVLFTLTRAREHFSLTFKKEFPFVTMESDYPKGYEAVSTYPISCRIGQENDAGLCYDKCRAGFHGVGPVCWADTVNVGIGKPIGLEPCPNGWVNDGLICRQPITNDCSWKGAFGECWGKLRGGNLRGRLDNGGVCDWPDKTKLPTWLVEMKKTWVYKGTKNEVPEDKLESTDPSTIEKRTILVASHPDRVAGLCYRKCPRHLPVHVPGMPYLCYKGEGLSYGRGVGTIPPFFRYADKEHTFP